MTDAVQTAIEAEARPPHPRRPLLRAIGWLLAGLAALVGIALLSIDTSPGHRLIVERIAGLKIRTGLRIRIGRIDGSIWSHAVLRDVRLYDLRGQFFEAPEIRLDWHPLAWTRNRLDIDRLTSDLVTLDRLPRLRSTANAPILPGFDIRIGTLAIDRLRLGKEVAGTAAAARLAARADIRGRRAMIGLALTSDRRDRVALDMDAMPDGDLFHLAGRLDSPAGGVVGGLFGTRRPIAARIDGEGGWHVWNGKGVATVSGRPVADLALTVRDGRYGLAGRLAPAPYLQGKLQRLTSPRILVAGQATLANRRLDGKLGLSTPALRLGVGGRIDLARSAFAGFGVDLALLEPRALFPNMTGRDIRLHVGLEGAFRSAAFRYALTSPHLAFDQTGFDRVRATGEGRVTRLPLALPIRLAAARVTGVGTVAGGILANLAVGGVLHVDARQVTGSGLALSSDKLKGKLGLHLDLASGRFDVALSGGLRRYLIPGLGIVDVDSTLTVLPGPNGLGTIVAGRGTADIRRFDNAFLRSLAGGLPHIVTRLVRNPDQTIRFTDLVLTGPAIRIVASGLRRRDGSFQLAGNGRQAVYGPFRIALDGQIDHPKVDLLFDRPVDALGLRAVRVTLDPVPQGFTFRAAGRSYLGAFAGNGAIRTPPVGITTIEVASLAVSGTRAAGILRALPAGLDGQLKIDGGGIGGRLLVAPQGLLQRIEPHLTFAGATLAADTPITVRRGRLDGTVLLDPAGARLDLALAAAGVARGKLALGRLGVAAHLVGGVGTVGVTASGSRGRGFTLAADARIAPSSMTIALKGDVDGQPLAFGGPARLAAEGDGWRLAPIRIGYGGGAATVGASFGGARVAVDATLDRLPLALLDLVSPAAGLAGDASGGLTYAGAPGQPPTGRADLSIHGLSRSGLVLASQPIDLGVAAVLTRDGLAMRAVAASGGGTIGRAQARVAPLAPDGDTATRIGRAPLFAQLRYVGPGDILWRLVGVRTIDLSGPLSIGADIGGTLDRPLIHGSVDTAAGRIESALTGTIVQNIKASGRFDGSRLRIDRMSGTTPNGGTVSGRGAFDLSLASGVGIDLALQADNAQLLNRDDIAATVTGPLTLRSNGRDGTIAGDVVLNRGRYRLGAAAAAQVGQLKVVELNRPDSDLDDLAPPPPWSLDLKARAPGRLMVTGLGLDSEWRATLTIRGAVNNPAIGGKADLIRGGYQFAGRRFDLTRGIIRFSGDAPPDPILDITAGANLQGLNASIRVTGTGLHPDISFESVPALPEDELLSRLLFGTSITNLSAPEALQLAAAVAALRDQGKGGGLNLDPINAVRRAVHLDRLRVLPADVTTGQKTSIAAGKYIGRRTYVEVVTDGAGYSATSVEFRITRWLSLLSTISTVGRQSANIRVSKDY